ncbi:MAG: hypothetical protein MUF34_16720 [Polyangiaceae bacterium]|nr:hypothetical protein [Polyangiaceae bacterium]
MFGFSSSELVLVALIVGLVLVAGRVGAWGEAIGRRWVRGRPPTGGALPGPGASHAGALPGPGASPVGALPGSGAPPVGPLPPNNGA